MNSYFSSLLSKATSLVTPNAPIQMSNFSTNSYKITSFKVNSGPGLVEFQSTISFLNSSSKDVENYIKRLKTLKHPYIVRFISSTTNEITTEQVIPLSIESNRLKEDKELIAYGLYCIRDALDFIHRNGLVHGNLSFDSIFVTETGEFKLGGFEKCNVGSDHSKDDSDFASIVQQLLSADYSMLNLSTNLYYDITNKLDSLQIMSDDEKIAFMRQLDNILFSASKVSLSPKYKRHKITNCLLKSLELNFIGIKVLNFIIRLANETISSNDEYGFVFDLIKKKFTPNAPPITRITVLENIHLLSDRLSKDIVNDLFPSISVGFADPNPQIRELTIRSVLYLAPYTSSYLRYFSQTQNDTEPTIRTNTVICLCKIQKHVPMEHRKIFCLAFSKALKDPFVPCRVAGVQSLISSIELYDDEECVSIIKSLSNALLDVEEVRLPGFKAIGLYIEKLKKVSDEKSKVEKIEREKAEKVNNTKIPEQQEREKIEFKASKQENTVPAVTSVSFSTATEPNQSSFTNKSDMNDGTRADFNIKSGNLKLKSSVKGNDLISNLSSELDSWDSLEIQRRESTETNTQNTKDDLARKKEERRLRIEALKQQRRAAKNE